MIEARAPNKFAGWIWPGAFVCAFLACSSLGWQVVGAGVGAGVIASAAFALWAAPRGRKLIEFCVRSASCAAGFASLQAIWGRPIWMGMAAAGAAVAFGPWALRQASHLFLRIAARDPARQVAAPNQAPTATAGFERLEGRLEKLRSRQKVPALAAAFATHNTIVAAGAIGARVANRDIATEINDKFHFGSITKTMTATVAGALVDEGLVDWTATLEEFGDEDLVNAIPPALRAVTLEQFLSHRSGVSPVMTRGESLEAYYDSDLPARHQRRRYLASRLSQEKLKAARRGARFQYSNVNYAVAGHMLEQATDCDWETLLQSRLFDALGMARSGVGSPCEAGDVSEPWGHSGHNLPVMPGPRSDFPPALAPGASAHGSILDLARFGQLHLRGALGVADIAPSPATIQYLHKPKISASRSSACYGLGVFVKELPWTFGPAISHTGSIGTWAACLWAAPGRDAVMAVAVNSGHPNATMALDRTTQFMIDRYLK